MIRLNGRVNMGGGVFEHDIHKSTILNTVMTLIIDSYYTHG